MGMYPTRTVNVLLRAAASHQFVDFAAGGGHHLRSAKASSTLGSRNPSEGDVAIFGDNSQTGMTATTDLVSDVDTYGLPEAVFVIASFKTVTSPPQAIQQQLLPDKWPATPGGVGLESAARHIAVLQSRLAGKMYGATLAAPQAGTVGTEADTDGGVISVEVDRGALAVEPEVAEFATKASNQIREALTIEIGEPVPAGVGMVHISVTHQQVPAETSTVEMQAVERTPGTWVLRTKIARDAAVAAAKAAWATKMDQFDAFLEHLADHQPAATFPGYSSLFTQPAETYHWMLPDEAADAYREQFVRLSDFALKARGVGTPQEAWQSAYDSDPDKGDKSLAEWLADKFPKGVVDGLKWLGAEAWDALKGAASGAVDLAKEWGPTGTLTFVGGLAGLSALAKEDWFWPVALGVVALVALK